MILVKHGLQRAAAIALDGILCRWLVDSRLQVRRGTRLAAAQLDLRSQFVRRRGSHMWCEDFCSQQLHAFFAIGVGLCFVDAGIGRNEAKNLCNSCRSLRFRSFAGDLSQQDTLLVILLSGAREIGNCSAVLLHVRSVLLNPIGPEVGTRDDFLEVQDYTQITRRAGRRNRACPPWLHFHTLHLVAR